MIVSLKSERLSTSSKTPICYHDIVENDRGGFCHGFTLSGICKSIKGNLVNDSAAAVSKSMP